MKDWQDLIWQTLLGLLIIFIGGGILGGALNLIVAAIPETAGLIFCPEGRTAIVNPDANQRDRFPILCQDQNGVSLPPLPDSQITALQRKYFYTPSYIIVSVLVVGWFLRPFVQKMFAKKKIYNNFPTRR